MQTNNFQLLPELSFLQGIIDVFPFYVMILNREHQIVGINKIGQEIKKRPLNQIIGRHCYALYHDLDHPFQGCPMEKAVKNKSIEVEEFFDTTSKRWIRAKIYPLPPNLTWNGSELYLHISEDITHVRNLEEEVLKTQSLDLVRFMSRGISHDIMNLLQILMSHAIISTETSSMAEIQYHLEQIVSSIDHIKTMIQELSRFSAEIMLIKTECQINDVLQALLKINIIPPQVDLKLNLDTHLPWLHIDKNKISEVFQNLLINAIQAISSQGWLHITTQQIVIDSLSNLGLKEGAYVEIIFSDSGCGISPQNMAKIFNPLFTTKKNGHGLGLAMSNLIVKAHQGLIKVASEEGKGTKFTIYLPRE